MKMLLVLASGLTLMIGSVEAATIKKTLASFDITPCSRASGYRDDLGIWWPTIKFARQSVDLNVTLTSILDAEELNRVFNDCNNIALATAGGVSVFSGNPGSFAGTYKATFESCLQTHVEKNAISLNVGVDSTCHW